MCDLFIFGLLKVQAQHDSMDMKKGMNMSSIDTMPVMKNMQHHMSMSHIYSLNLPMGRNGSGQVGYLMLHPCMHTCSINMVGCLCFMKTYFFDTMTRISRIRVHVEITRFDVPAWLMLMGQRQVGKNGLFHFSTMFSFDAFTAAVGRLSTVISNRRVL